MADIAFADLDAFAFSDVVARLAPSADRFAGELATGAFFGLLVDVLALVLP